MSLCLLGRYSLGTFSEDSFSACRYVYSAGMIIRQDRVSKEKVDPGSEVQVWTPKTAR